MFKTFTIFTSFCILTACATPRAQILEPSRTIPSAQLRAASFVTHDLEASIEFYSEYLGYKVIGQSTIDAAKSRQVVGVKSDATVRYAALAVDEWSPEGAPLAGISFIEIPSSQMSPFLMNSNRASRAGEVVLAHRVWGIEDINRKMIAAGIPIIATLGPSGSGKSKSMAVLDPNGTRVEMYEY